MAWVRKAGNGVSPDENTQPFGGNNGFGSGGALSALAATATPFVRSGSNNSKGSGDSNFGSLSTYESNGTVYFANPNGEKRERTTITSSGQHVIILEKAVNAERHCDFDSR